MIKRTLECDALSRRGKAPEYEAEDENEADYDFDAKFYAITASDESINPMAQGYLHDANYIDDDLILDQYPATLQRPNGLIN